MNQEKNQHVDIHEPRGINRITRHPLFCAFAFFGLGMFLRHGRAVDAAYWLPYAVFFVVGGMHQDTRQRLEKPAEYYEKTSLIPFQAILEGRNSLHLAVQEMNWHAAAVAVTLAMVAKYVPGVPRIVKE